MLSRFSNKKRRGFTLIELIMVMGIMTVMTTLILSRHSQFNSTVLLRDFAYDIGLSIRLAQVYGISGKSTASGVLGVQYGVYFSASSNNTYALFADANSNGQYAASEVVEQYAVRQGYTISDFCATTSGGIEKCASAGALSYLTIMFKRPDPDALIASDVIADTYTSAVVTARSASGDTRTVTVTNTGQISISSGS